MIPALEYHRPGSLDAVLDLLRSLGGDAVPLAGGTDLVVDLARGAKRAGHVVSLRDVDALRGIRREGGSLRIGALTTPAALAASEEVRAGRPEFLDAVRVFGGPQVRNRATVGGNLCTAASCGDLPPILLVLGARVLLVGAEGRRELPLASFFLDVRRTALRPGEILEAVLVPVRGPEEGAKYEVFGRRAALFVTVAGVAAFLRVEDGVCRVARVALSAVAPTPFLVAAAGEVIEGRPLDEGSMRRAAAAAAAAARPLCDVRGSAEHRTALVEVLAMRALHGAAERTRS